VLIVVVAVVDILAVVIKVAIAVTYIS